MKPKTYAEKLRDPRWQKLRLEIMQRDGFKCRHCGDKEQTLNVHHSYYEKGFNPWDYPDQTLFTLCIDCHSKVEDVKLCVGLEISNNPQLRDLLASLLTDPKLTSLVGSFADWNTHLIEFREENSNAHAVEGIRDATLHIIRILSGTLDSVEREFISE